MRILGIGIATLDIINLVERYPPEDAEVRALGQRVSRGGNVTNTLVVLSQLGHSCVWAGMLAQEPDSQRILADLHAQGVDTGPCVHHPGGKAPTSYICLSRANGSRTIVHYRDLPEFSCADFRRIDLGGWDWVHFEGREPPETRCMLEHLRRRRPGLRCSVEIEKPREGIEALFEGPDLLLFSRAFAKARGYQRPAELLTAMRGRTHAPLLVCAWGESGAAAMDERGGLCESPGFAPPHVVETLGAGDVFNAGIIHGRLHARPLAEILTGACRLAGHKCGQSGLRGLDERLTQGIVADQAADTPSD
jgi:ketohexokinase